MYFMNISRSQITTLRFVVMPKGLRRISDNKPDLPEGLENAQSLPPKVTEKYVMFSDHEGPYLEACVHQWYPSPFIDPDSTDEATDESLKFRTAKNI